MTSMGLFPPLGKQKWIRGVGRWSVYTTCTGDACMSATHCANSFAFGSVAERNTILAFGGAKMMDSSQNTPRARSRL